MLILTDAEIVALAKRPIKELTDDELALVAEQALKTESERRSARYDHDQRCALQQLREVVADAVNDRP